MDKIKIALISLGCEKNLVDSESILGLFKNDRYEITNELSEADGIIVNTCGFITSAKEEAINTIYEVIEYQPKAKIIVCGCLVQRYLDDLKGGIPEVDLWIPIREYHNFGNLLGKLFDDYKLSNLCPTSLNRVVSTPAHLAYVRISDGCNNRCTYCAIPLIRGNFVSRPKDDILTEIKYLVKSGRKEICLISQDLTKYGIDLDNYNLEKLLLDIMAIPGDYHIRMLYLYPDEISDELIQIVKNNPRIMPYFDIPIQHASNKLLKWMHRRGDKEFIRALINKIRQEIPDSVIRTTIIVGFPHETDKDFNELIEFIKDVKFDHLGAFTYSKEEDTLSYNMSGQVPSAIKQKRYDELMETQKWISLKQNERYLNKVYKCVIEEKTGDHEYVGRTYAYAPDDIDGAVMINCSEELKLNEFYDVLITDVDFYDIIGVIKK